MGRPVRTVLTCEHGGNSIPARYRAAFRGYEDILKSHRGYDPGAREMAVTISRGLEAPLHASGISRLLVDVNRSTHHHRLFSEISGSLGSVEKAAILERYYLPYRGSVVSDVKRSVKVGQTVLHLSMHTFSPILGGVIRRADIGLLYDPQRKKEAAFCLKLKGIYAGLLPDFTVRRNYPYAGRSDGLVSSLRKTFDEESYLGVEIEVNQKYPAGDRIYWRKLRKVIMMGLRTVIKGYNSLILP